jgi:hypothetical protein
MGLVPVSFFFLSFLYYSYPPFNTKTGISNKSLVPRY